MAKTLETQGVSLDTNPGTVSEPLSTKNSALPDLDASKLTIQLTPNPKEVPAEGFNPSWRHDLTTDHMITCTWTDETGWQTPALVPYGPFQIMPTASVLHYATECFEGMKCYRGYDNKLRLFRPQLNAARMLMSSTRIALPPFNPEELVKLIYKLVATDGGKWLPKPGSFFYIRPTSIATHPALGVQKPREALLYVICCAFPTLDAKPMKLLASEGQAVRAWPGGWGYAKVGANYGPSLMASDEAQKQGFNQILWLFGEENYVTEAGASNFFVLWRNKETQKLELITAPLTDKLILDGVTRRSVLELARERLTKAGAVEGLEEIEVVERKYTMDEVALAAEEGRLVEGFAAGTAFFVVAVSLVSYKGKDIIFPNKGTNADGTGVYGGAIKKWLKDTMFGNEEGKKEWVMVIDEKDSAYNQQQ
ncbi:branched-chain amino acid aminotransferase II [Ascobolus immersus RN42]|uniref:Branched-chain-amino-acid aminotransferase n=1 Tax=Ascobolus immersus RN42 TaxID=1160509 RepID=A0A3N4HVB1_ASCIM|nr:branched-chain amino acid aminotransferase II [Ascobolus immersus RN42]